MVKLSLSADEIRDVDGEIRERLGRHALTSPETRTFP
jgi:hypothetical protein